MTRTVVFSAVVVSILLCLPTDAIACGCGGPISSSLAVGHADVVFVGTVTRIDRRQAVVASRQNADGSVTATVDPNAGGPDFVVFDVAHVYKGPQVPQLALVRGNTTCDMPFKDGEKWIVYAEETTAGISAFRCSRTRLYADGAQDVIYLENSQHGRPQGIVYGNVLRHRDGASGKALYALFETLRVVAANASGRFSTSTDPWGPFELVLPPGDFEVWVERADKPVASRRRIHVENGADMRVQLVVEFADAHPGKTDR